MCDVRACVVCVVLRKGGYKQENGQRTHNGHFFIHEGVCGDMARL
jgi:hypothetical protein